MTDFLNACIFCFGVSAVIGAIIGHEDALALAILAIAAVVFRVVVWVVGHVKWRYEKWVSKK